MTINLAAIARLLGIQADSAWADLEITGVGPIDSATHGQLTFVTSSEYLKFVPTAKASAILVKSLIEDCPVVQLVTKDPYLGFAKVSQLFFKWEHTYSGISTAAHIEPGADVHPTATIFPNSYVSKYAKIGAESVIYPGVFIGSHVQIGEKTTIRANTVIESGTQIGSHVHIFANTTIGADGFGFAPSREGMEKIPQTGIVVIEDHVEIGPGCTVDRATFGETRIGSGTKMDSQVHIGHNVKLGRHNLICGKSGFAGSAQSEDFVIVGGNSNISNLVTLHSGVRVGAASTVTKSLRDPGDYVGYPAEPIREWRKMTVMLRKLEEIEKRLKKAESKLTAFESGSEMGDERSNKSGDES